VLSGKSKTIQVEPVALPMTAPEPEEAPVAKVETEAAEVEPASVP
jgi:hypothetical protein